MPPDTTCRQGSNLPACPPQDEPHLPAPRLALMSPICQPSIRILAGPRIHEVWSGIRYSPYMSVIKSTTAGLATRLSRTLSRRAGCEES